MRKARFPPSFLGRFGSLDILGILARGASVALLIQVAGNGVGYISQILLARWLGVNGFGVYIYLVTWAQVFTIGALMGLDLGMIRFISEYTVREDWSRLAGIIRWGRGLVIVTGLLLAAVSAGVLLILRPIQTTVVTFLLGSFLIPLLALVEVQTQIIRSTRRIAWAYAPPNLIEPLLLLGLALGILRVLGGLTGSLSLLALSLSICLILVLQEGVIHRLFSGLTQYVHPKYEVRGWLAISFPFLIISLLSILLMRVDTLAVGMFLGTEAVGIYGAAIKTATIVGLSLLAANAIVGPMIATYYARREMAGLQDVVSLATLGAFGVSLVAAGGVMLLSSPILGAFGGEFLRARLPLFVLILGQMVSAGSGSVGLLMVLTGLERRSVMVLAWCVLILIVACYLVIPKFGIVGAAAVSTLAISLCNLWMYCLVVKHLGIHPSIFFAIRRVIFAKD